MALKMRLSIEYREVIKKYFNQFFHDGEIYLFGSRVDDSKKGHYRQHFLRK